MGASERTDTSNASPFPVLAGFQIGPRRQGFAAPRCARPGRLRADLKRSTDRRERGSPERAPWRPSKRRRPEAAEAGEAEEGRNGCIRGGIRNRTAKGQTEFAATASPRPAPRLAVRGGNVCGRKRGTATDFRIGELLCVATSRQLKFPRSSLDNDEPPHGRRGRKVRAPHSDRVPAQPTLFGCGSSGRSKGPTVSMAIACQAASWPDRAAQSVF